MYTSVQKSEYLAPQFDQRGSLELRKKTVAVCMAFGILAVSGCSQDEKQSAVPESAASESDNHNDSNYSVTGLECNSNELTVSVTARGVTLLRLENRDHTTGFHLLKSDDAHIVTSVDSQSKVSDQATVKGDLAQNIAITLTDFDAGEAIHVLSFSEYGDTIDEVIDTSTACKM